MINKREQVKRMLKLDQIALEFNLPLPEVFQKYAMINKEVYIEHIYQGIYNEDLEKASKFLSSGENRGKVVKIGRKVGRNEKCPCGSGLKYKKCCLEI